MVICLKQGSQMGNFCLKPGQGLQCKDFGHSTLPKLPWGIRIPPLLDSGNLPPILTINTLLGFPLPTAFIAEIRK